MKAADLAALLRPAQWIKNGFVFAALVFSLHLTDRAAVARTVAAFVVFCLASSAAYAGNDCLDAARDGLHRSKRSRPVAAGRILPRQAALLSLALAGLALAGAALAIANAAVDLERDAAVGLASVATALGAVYTGFKGIM